MPGAGRGGSKAPPLVTRFGLSFQGVVFVCVICRALDSGGGARNLNITRTGTNSDSWCYDAGGRRVERPRGGLGRPDASDHARCILLQKVIDLLHLCLIRVETVAHSGKGGVTVRKPGDSDSGVVSYS